MSGRLWGVCGHPWADLSSLLDTSCFPALDRELTRGLATVESSYTGGTLKWMGVVAPWALDDEYRDAMHAIEEMDDDEFDEFVSLGDFSDQIDRSKRAEYRFGDETDFPFNYAQQRLLTIRHGAYFPWKTCYHLLENDRWEDKHSGKGKSFSEEACRVFPQTVAFLRSLPFREIGRCVLFGLEANDHAPLHRDTEPGRSLQLAQCISFAPREGKRFYLQNRPEDAPTMVTSPIYWFNDMDYHGVLADPYFRYSIRVDGVFEPSFAQALERHLRSTARNP